MYASWKLPYMSEGSRYEEDWEWCNREKGFFSDSSLKAICMETVHDNNLKIKMHESTGINILTCLVQSWHKLTQTWLKTGFIFPHPLLRCLFQNLRKTVTYKLMVIWHTNKTFIKSIKKLN
jgi:hypothetical protein